MERVRIGVDVPIWVWLSDLLVAISYIVSFLSFVVSMWMVYLGYKVWQSSPVIFGIMTLIFLFLSRPYVNTKQTMQELVKHDDEEEPKED